jgi:hypothetical protein
VRGEKDKVVTTWRTSLRLSSQRALLFFSSLEFLRCASPFFLQSLYTLSISQHDCRWKDLRYGTAPTGIKGA